MVKKGLCITCVHDSDCSFPRKFPVLQCEEFYCGEPKSQDSLKKQSKRKKNQAKKKQRGNELSKLVSDFDIAGIKFKSHLRRCLL